MLRYARDLGLRERSAVEQPVRPRSNLWAQTCCCDWDRVIVAAKGTASNGHHKPSSDILLPVVEVRQKNESESVLRVQVYTAHDRAHRAWPLRVQDGILHHVVRHYSKPLRIFDDYTTMLCSIVDLAAMETVEVAIGLIPSESNGRKTGQMVDESRTHTDCTFA